MLLNKVRVAALLSTVLFLSISHFSQWTSATATDGELQEITVDDQEPTDSREHKSVKRKSLFARLKSKSKQPQTEQNIPSESHIPSMRSSDSESNVQVSGSSSRSGSTNHLGSKRSLKMPSSRDIRQQIAKHTGRFQKGLRNVRNAPLGSLKRRAGVPKFQFILWRVRNGVSQNYKVDRPMLAKCNGAVGRDTLPMFKLAYIRANYRCAMTNPPGSNFIIRRKQETIGKGVDDYGNELESGVVVSARNLHKSKQRPIGSVYFIETTFGSLGEGIFMVPAYIRKGKMKTAYVVGAMISIAMRETKTRGKGFRNGVNTLLWGRKIKPQERRLNQVSPSFKNVHLPGWVLLIEAEYVPVDLITKNVTGSPEWHGVGFCVTKGKDVNLSRDWTGGDGDPGNEIRIKIIDMPRSQSLGKSNAWVLCEVEIPSNPQFALTEDAHVAAVISNVEIRTAASSEKGKKMTNNVRFVLQDPSGERIIAGLTITLEKGVSYKTSDVTWKRPLGVSHDTTKDNSPLNFNTQFRESNGNVSSESDASYESLQYADADPDATSISIPEASAEDEPNVAAGDALAVHDRDESPAHEQKDETQTQIAHSSPKSLDQSQKLVGRSKDGTNETPTESQREIDTQPSTPPAKPPRKKKTASSSPNLPVQQSELGKTYTSKISLNPSQPNTKSAAEVKPSKTNGDISPWPLNPAARPLSSS